IEGGALGVAVVDHFRRRGATLIATSHYDALKTYASTTDGVASAAFGFDADTFAPTYQLLYGSPGRSLALEIAARLGLNATVVAAARQNLSAREAQLAEHLAKIDRDLRSLEHEQRLATRERETLSEAEGRMRQREEALRQREETFRRRLNEELETQVRSARREIDDVIADLNARGKRMRSSVRDLRVIGGGPAPAAKVSVHVELQPREAGPADLNVIGCSVDEAIARAERFLDESLLTDQRVVRVIHGYGT